MTRTVKLSATLLLMLGLSANALAEDCVAPGAPIIPDGNVASQDELVAASGAFKAFQTKFHDYRDCLTEKEKAIPVDAENAEAMKAALLASDTKAFELLNTTADELNQAIKTFKAR